MVYMADYLITKAEFAKRCNVSRNAVYKAVSTGRVVCTVGGKINIQNPVNIDYLKRKTEDGYEEAQNAKINNLMGAEIMPVVQADLNADNNNPVVKKKPPKKKPKSKPPAEPEPPAVPNAGSTELMYTSRAELERLKLVSAIEKTNLETEIKRGRYVDKTSIQTLFAKIYEIHMNEFLTVKDKLNPDLSAIFGVADAAIKTESAEKIDETLWKVLDRIKFEINKYLNEIKVEPVSEK